LIQRGFEGGVILLEGREPAVQRSFKGGVILLEGREPAVQRGFKGGVILLEGCQATDNLCVQLGLLSSDIAQVPEYQAL
jgi:hypothetical protein